MLACSKPSEPQRADTAGAQTAKLVLLTRDGCMNTDALKKNLDAAIEQLGRPVAYDVVDQGTLAETDARRGYPTPTLFANRDVLGLPEPKPPFPEPT
jgi:hypothetical protein